MAVVHYYVSGENGDDGNDGLSELQAWATIDFATSQNFAGDTDGAEIHIAPSTYRENPVVDFAGHSTGLAKYIGDPLCLWFDNEIPGRVRVTSCDASEDWDTDVVITVDKDYNEFHWLWIDGGGGAVDGITADKWTRKVFDCVCQCGLGLLDVECHRVINSGGNFNKCKSFNCVGFGGNYTFYRRYFYNCLAIGSSGGAFTQGSGIGFNNVALNCYKGFGSQTHEHCIAIVCSLPDDGTGTYNDCYGIGCTNGNFPAGRMALLNLGLLRDLLWVLGSDDADGLQRQGDNTTPAFDATDVDWSGHRLRLRGGDLDIGPVAIANPFEMDQYANIAAGFTRITEEGDQLFYVPALAGRAVTVHVTVRHNSITGSKPQIVLRGDSISEQTATAVAADATWEELEVTATPTKDETLTLVLRSRSSAGSADFQAPRVRTA